MKKLLTLITFVTILSWSPTHIGMASSGHDAHGDKAPSESVTMERATTVDTFSHQETVEGIRAEFQVMSLERMNMKDPEGKTHHIMVKFSHKDMNHQIKEAVGKIKVISPSGQEQVEALENYSGILAANFTFQEKGKYGVICLFKVDGKKGMIKFWYPHG